ncbi:MAG: SUMF1/EgtB/PvdO family nonheme iron enzyme, partial [Pyrinomonadaceae bacterium]|nr:SUMF1/EgtB/PvdO family nonheme iron enzyme [Pyrinomonadaceae bacterium]
TKEPNAYGLYDMHGNVAEWCEDLYNQTYDELPVDGNANTTVGDPKYHVSRGGSWSNFPPYMRLTQREKSLGERRNIVIGFRVAARLR